MKAYERVKEGGLNRIKYSFPPLVFKALQLVQRIYATERTEATESIFIAHWCHWTEINLDLDNEEEEEAAWQKKLKRIFKFTNDLISALQAEAELAQIAFRLYLECALAAGKAKMANFAYGFLTKGTLFNSTQESSNRW